MEGPDRAASRPECFGVLDKVFPVGPGGIRVVPLECWECRERVECLRRATQEGAGREVLQDELAERQENALGGVAGFLRRWSRLKAKHRKEGS